MTDMVSLLLTYLFPDSPPLSVAVGAADGGCWVLLVMLLLLLLMVVRTNLSDSSALHFFTAGGFLHRRTAVLLRTDRELYCEIQFEYKMKAVVSETMIAHTGIIFVISECSRI